MSKLKPLLIVGSILLLGGWVALGLLIWSRNSVPALNVTTRAALPHNNAYSEYTQLVRSVRQAKPIFESMVYKRSPSAATKRGILKENSPILAKLHVLAGRPSVVTDLEPGVDFVAARDFPNVGQLSIWKAESQNPAEALDTLIDGLYFAEGSGRDGAFLHLTTAFTCHVPLFMALDGVVPKVPAAACEKAANRVRKLVESQGSLAEIVRNERRARIRQLTSTFPDPYRGFKLKAFGDDYGWDYVMKPKAPALKAINSYLSQWENQVDRPFVSITPPSQPEDKSGVVADDALSPGNIRNVLLRYYYKDARLRVLHAALRARAAGTPVSLSGLVEVDLLKDPFNGAPLTYTRAAVYSVGPDGTDSGGSPLADSQLRPGVEGDLVYRLAP